MKYRMSENAREAIARLPKMSDSKLNDFLDWVCMRRESCREEALRMDADPTDRLMSLSGMIDCERVYTQAWMEAERRMDTPCETCGDEGHVESEDYPHEQVVECPTCA